MRQAELKKMTLIPIHSGDWEREKDKIMSNITLKRFCCGSDHLGTQIVKFWSIYEAHTRGISSDTPITEILKRFIVYVQKHLVFLNYLYCNTFTWGYLDSATMNAIKRCKKECESMDGASEEGASESQQIPSSSSSSSSLPTMSKGKEGAENEGYLTPQIITFLSSQVQIIVRSMKSAGIGSGDRDISRMLRLENAKLSSSRIKHYKNDGMLNWISFLKSSLGLNINKSIISQYSALVSGIKAAKEAKEARDEKESVAESSVCGDDDDDDESNNGNGDVGADTELPKERHGKKKKSKGSGKKKKTDEFYDSDDDFDDDDDRSELGTKDEVVSTLRQELEAERAKCGQLEKKVSKLEADEEQLRSDWTELQANYTKLQQQYWLLIYEADERTKQMNELRQASSITNTRLLRELAKANELLNANKYSIQSNTQKINKIDNSFREVARKNKSFVSHVIVPILVNVFLGCKIQ